MVHYGSFISQKTLKLTVHHLLSTKQQADSVRDQQVNMAEHLAAKELDILTGVGRDKNRNQLLQNQWLKIQLFTDKFVKSHKDM